METVGLRIPESQRGAFLAIANVNSNQLEAILSVLRELRPSTQLSSSAQILAKKAEIEEGQAARILVTTSSLFTLQERLELSPDDLRQELLDAIRADGDLSAIKEHGHNNINRFLKEVLALGGTLGVASKVWTVAQDSERLYCLSRVLTDLRPVFKPNSEEAAVFVAIHNLKIAYHENNELKEFFVAMSADDLRELLKVLQRAERKQENLKSILENADLLLVEEE